MSPSSDEWVGRETNTLWLNLGPVGWFDFEGLNGAFRQHPEIRRPEELYEYYVGLSSLLSEGRVDASRLSNILDNSVTIVTSDGYVGYQRRSRRLSLRGGALTSTVAENTNRFLDDARPDDPLSLYNTSDTMTQAPTSYVPQGVPHPVAATLRGIASEVSPVVRAAVGLEGVYVTGISFDLEGLHPSLLFAVFTHLSHLDIVTAKRTHPGSEHFEGSLGFVPADLEHEETRSLLREPNWIPNGKASIIRAIEVVRSLTRNQRTSVENVIKKLRDGGFTIPRSLPEE